MELVSQIINSLIDDEKSLNSALLKTKVLARRIQNSELLEWVDGELSGYKDYADLPAYRKNIFNDLKGSYMNGSMKYSNVQIPTAGLDKNFEHKLRSIEFMESVTGLEEYLTSCESSTLTSPLRAENISLIEENFQNMGNPYLQIISIYRVIAKTPF